MIRNIPQTSRDGDDQVHNPGLYTWISHVYRLRDTNEKKEEVERTLLSDISTIFQRLRQSAAELSADNAGGNGVIASVSIDSPPSSENDLIYYKLGTHQSNAGSNGKPTNMLIAIFK